MAVPEVVGTAVLRDFPLRLWARQEEHTQELLREFTLIIQGRETDASAREVPQRLLEIAEQFTTLYGPLIEQLTEERQAALDAGLDRIDSEVPLPKDTPQLLVIVREIVDAVDEYCRQGDLLALARPQELVAFNEWSMGEAEAQLNGAEPTPWPGPF